jgi:hypothetical protein
MNWTGTIGRLLGMRRVRVCKLEQYVCCLITGCIPLFALDWPEGRRQATFLATSRIPSMVGNNEYDGNRISDRGEDKKRRSCCVVSPTLSRFELTAPIESHETFQDSSASTIFVGHYQIPHRSGG